MRRIFFRYCLVLVSTATFGQDSTKIRAITAEEFEKAKSFRIKDLDRDTYVKFENTYVLDRYEGRKPYIITGDDGLKKRIDIYRLLLRETREELGSIVYYTNEEGNLYQVCMPNFKADGKLWGRYFEDIHAIDKLEPNFVLKLSYVLSREFGFQLYKSANAGRDVSGEAGTYGTDICFPGDVTVLMSNGRQKRISEVKTGEELVTLDPSTGNAVITKVNALVAHTADNYAVTKLELLKAVTHESRLYVNVTLSQRELVSTPNHPILTEKGPMQAGEVTAGDHILCRNTDGDGYTKYTVWRKSEKAGGMQAVYNIEAATGNTFVINGVMVLQKALK